MKIEILKKLKSMLAKLNIFRRFVTCLQYCSLKDNDEKNLKETNMKIFPLDTASDI